jgi:hypothetical protein
LGYSDSATFADLLAHLAPQAASIAADELPSLLWAASALAAERPAQQRQQQQADRQQQPDSDTSSSSSTQSTRQAATDSSCAGPQKQQQQQQLRLAVPRRDGVAGAMDSARLAGLPQVLQFMLGASQALAGGVVGGWEARDTRGCRTNFRCQRLARDTRARAGRLTAPLVRLLPICPPPHTHTQRRC